MPEAPRSPPLASPLSHHCCAASGDPAVINSLTPTDTPRIPDQRSPGSVHTPSKLNSNNNTTPSAVQTSRRSRHASSSHDTGRCDGTRHCSCCRALGPPLYPCTATSTHTQAMGERPPVAHLATVRAQPATYPASDLPSPSSPGDPPQGWSNHGPDRRLHDQWRPGSTCPCQPGGQPSSAVVHIAHPPMPTWPKHITAT
jgi:hypothetical protein